MKDSYFNHVKIRSKLNKRNKYTLLPIYKVKNTRNSNISTEYLEGGIKVEIYIMAYVKT